MTQGRVIKAENVITREPLVRQMQKELEMKRPRIDGIEHGKVTLIVQDGRLVRMEITESAKAETA
ncbi:MAG TPA: DUF2292 domain-containing protein [Firmicutes bacterium]|nr:DUF2292 domain-containing protein [Bacillota bacterium]